MPDGDGEVDAPRRELGNSLAGGGIQQRPPRSGRTVPSARPHSSQPGA